MPAERARKILVIGLDGLEPKIVGPLIDAGELPNLARLRESGGDGRVATTYPAQTPVAWSSFATGTNPGGHGIYDFVRRDPETYLPDLALNRYEQKSALLPPRAVNLRHGRAVWEILGDAGIPSVVLRCPCTYPPDKVRGRLLSGMGVPDVRGGLGTSTFYTTDPSATAGESEQVVHLRRNGDGAIDTQVIGPRNPRSGSDALLDVRITIERDAVVVRSAGRPAEMRIRLGAWSDWLKVKFKIGKLQSVHGMMRFLLVGLEPFLEIYASPVNFDSSTPMFTISAPWDYAGELERRIGTYYTTGMVEDHTGLNNGRFDEAVYLDQCYVLLAARSAMLQYELERFRDGLLYCLFDTPDRVQHMFWRFLEGGHPANGGKEPAEEMTRVIADHYRSCDAIVGRALERLDGGDLAIVLSDHGFSSFQRGVHLNTWLHDHGYLVLEPGYEPGEEAEDFLRHVDWSRTRAYALGLGSIYLNRRGREASGTLDGNQADETAAAIARGLTNLVDPASGRVAIRSVRTRDELYSGPCFNEAPDLIVNFAPEYRVSWGTALGEVPQGWFEDNTKRWSGDHIIDPPLVPGVLFMNRPFDGEGARLIDLAPTILGSLGLEKTPEMEGRSLLG